MLPRAEANSSTAGIDALLAKDKLVASGEHRRRERDLVDSVTEAWESALPGYEAGSFQFVARVVRLASIINDAISGSLAPWGLNSSDYGVLGTLRAAGPSQCLRPSDLSARLLMSSGGMSKVLSRLKSADYIERAPDSVDGRNLWVQLTPLGAETADAMLRAWTRDQRELFGVVSAAVGQEASDVLRSVLLDLGDEAPISGTSWSRTSRPIQNHQRRDT